jgi:hypothetical protein
MQNIAADDIIAHSEGAADLVRRFLMRNIPALTEAQASTIALKAESCIMHEITNFACE